MSKEFTAEEYKNWREKQPQKMVVVKVIIKSEIGRILLAKPSYKSTWQLPGGGVDDSESPEDAAVREVKEELGLNIAKSELNIKGTIYKRSDETLFLLYEYGKLLSEETDFTLQNDEVTDFQFTEPNEVTPLLSDYYRDFWDKYIF